MNKMDDTFQFRLHPKVQQLRKLKAAVGRILATKL